MALATKRRKTTTAKTPAFEPVHQARDLAQRPTFKLKAIKVPATEVRASGTEEPPIPLDREMTDSELARMFNWYNYLCDKKDAREWTEQLAMAYPRRKHLVARYKRMPDWQFSTTIGWLSRIIMRGGHIPIRSLRYVVKTMREMEAQYQKFTANTPQPTEAAAPVKEAPNIQARLEEKLSEVIGEIEGAVDDYSTQKKAFDTYKFLQSTNLAANFAARVGDAFVRRIAELEEYLEGRDSQLLEAYAHLGKRGAKDMIKFYQSIIDGANAYKAAKIATRAKPKRKPVPPEKVVRKLNYLKQFEELKLTSIDPRDILGCTELWIYNTKTRKLGRFVATTHGDTVIAPLGVKNSNITGFDENKSVAKTLRKPAEKLAEFKTQGKPGLRKFMDTIKSVETRLRPRISPETILLRAVK